LYIHARFSKEHLLRKKSIDFPLNLLCTFVKKKKQLIFSYCMALLLDCFIPLVCVLILLPVLNGAWCCSFSQVLKAVSITSVLFFFKIVCQLQFCWPSVPVSDSACWPLSADLGCDAIESVGQFGKSWYPNNVKTSDP
jgi:hypothetical protein